MLKKICFFLLIPAMGYAQSLNVSVDNATAGNQFTNFSLNQQNVSFANGTIRFLSSGTEFGNYLAYAVSPDHSIVGVLKNSTDEGMTFLLDTDADTLSSFSTTSMSYDDPSLALYPFPSGEVLLRSNIANFTLYNSLGSILTGGTSSSQSEQGESISEVATDPNGKTILIYTPKIKRTNGFGSQALLLNNNNSTENIFYSNNRFIKYAGVSGNGQFIVLITAQTGTDDRAIILDRFGNELNTITSGEELIAGYFTDNADQVLLHSSRRALVYSTMSGDRIGSTSFRSPLILARYFDEDQTIVGMTGSKVQNTDIYRNVEFHTINLSQREIARRQLSGGLGTSPNINLQIQREGNGRYKLKGANKIIELRASF